MDTESYLPAIPESKHQEVLDALAHGDVSFAQTELLKFPQQDCPVIHHFGPGLYIRELHMAPGLLIIGHHHKFEHMNIFLKGKLVVIREDGTSELLVAPAMYIGQPGRKVAYILEESIWQNIWPTTETDIEILEATYLQKDDEWFTARDSRNCAHMPQHDADWVDYAEFLGEFKTTDSKMQFRLGGAYAPFPVGSYCVKLGPSSLDGTGLFCTSSIKAGSVIAPAVLGGIKTPAGRFINHSVSPNAAMCMLPNGDLNLVALFDLSGCKGGFDGEEITVNYRQYLRATSPVPERISL